MLLPSLHASNTQITYYSSEQALKECKNILYREHEHGKMWNSTFVSQGMWSGLEIVWNGLGQVSFGPNNSKKHCDMLSICIWCFPSFSVWELSRVPTRTTRRRRRTTTTMSLVDRDARGENHGKLTWYTFHPSFPTPRTLLAGINLSIIHFQSN